MLNPLRIGPVEIVGGGAGVAYSDVNGEAAEITIGDEDVVTDGALHELLHHVA